MRVRNLERKSDYRQPEPPAIAKEIQGVESEIENGTESERRDEDETPPTVSGES